MQWKNELHVVSFESDHTISQFIRELLRYQAKIHMTHTSVSEICWRYLAITS